jgi:hypothetical protein
VRAAYLSLLRDTTVAELVVNEALGQGAFLAAPPRPGELGQAPDPA